MSFYRQALPKKRCSLFLKNIDEDLKYRFRGVCTTRELTMTEALEILMRKVVLNPSLLLHNHKTIK